MDLQLNVPARHAFEFRHILLDAGISYMIHNRPDPSPEDPFVFEVTTTAEKAVLAENLLADMDTYSAVTFVTARKLEETLRRAESLALEIVSNTVAFRILDRPYLHRLEVKGSELTLGRFYSKREIPALRLEVKNPELFTSSRGGSGKGTVAHINTPEPVKS